MGALEVIAVIFALIILVKLILVLIVKPKPIIKLAEKIYKQTVLISVCYIIILAVVAYFLFAELNIIQIAAAGLFGILLYGFILIQYPKELLKFSEEVLKDKQKAWLPWLFFVALALWVLYTVFI